MSSSTGTHSFIMFFLLQLLGCIALIGSERVIIDDTLRSFIPEIKKDKLCFNDTCLADENDVVVDTIVKFPDNNIIFRFDQFPKIEDIFQFMSFLASNFSDHVQVFDIGYTEENLPLRVLRIASPSLINSTVWIDGGIHAREWISITSVCFIMYILAVKWFSLNMAVQNTEFFIMPVVNPDGYRYSYTKDRLWRKNRRYNNKCYGVDLNRNFPYKWGMEHVLISDGPRAQKKVCNEIYEGPTAVSEAETLAITEFIESSKGKFQAFLTFHSFGPRINYPYGYEPRVPKDAPLLNFVAQKARNLIINMTKVKYDVLPLSMTEYVSPGNSMDWAYKMNITFSYLIELSNSSFITPTSEIVPTGKEAMIILMTVIDHLHMDHDEIATISPPNDLFEEQQWNQREKQIIEENRQLKQSISSAVSQQEFENFGKKLNNANEMINHLKSNLKKATEEWNKKEMKLIDECNQLRCKLKNSPKILQPDVEKLQEQLKDTQEVNVKLKLDLDSYKDKCRTLETLCADLKKVIVDEQIAEKVFANDNIPASVKQFLSSSSSSVFNTLSHMFGCLSRSASRNRNYLYSGQKGDLFTTTESSMINDLTKSCEQNELMKELLKEKEQLRKENQDLNRQVKELEIIVRRRTHPNFSNVSEIIRSEESRMYEKESEIIKNLKKELLEKQQIILDLKNQIVDSKALYDKNLLSLQSKIVNIQEESIKLKEELEKNKNAPTNYIAKNKRKGRSCDPPSHATRNFRIELAAKEREVQLLNKQLEELKKKNRKLIKERENNFVSSKEQSADIIQLKNNYAAIVTESEEDDRYKYSTSNQEVDIEGNNVIDTQIQKQNIENGNFESSDDLVHNCVNNSHKFKNKVSSRQEYPLQTNLNISNNSECSSEKLTSPEVNHQNLVQITCDLLKLLTKTEFAAKIRNSNYSSSQYDELNRFVTALKSVSD